MISGPLLYLREILHESAHGESLVTIQKKVPGLSEAALARFVTRARRLSRLAGAVSVLVTSSQELRGLNHRFRGKNKPTDVLSFPATPGLMRDFAGDVAISAQIAASNARRLGHSAAEEIRILTLHGLLHLAGYDHECDDGEMERKEARLRKALGLPVGLIERTARPAGARISRSDKNKAKRPPARSRLPVSRRNGAASRATRTSR